MGLASHHSEFMARALLELPQTFLVGVYDEDPHKGATFSEKFSIKYYDDLDSLLANPDVKAGVVTSENSKKRDYSIALARAGKHVICDKPLGVNAQQSKEIIQTCNKSHVSLQVGYVSRYSPEVQRARKLVSSVRQLGPVKFIDAENRVDSGAVKQLSPWLLKNEPAGGRGALLEHSVHAIDLVLWFNEKTAVRSVFATSAKKLDDSYEVEDNFAILVRFENGSVALVDGSYCRPSSGRRGDMVLKIHGHRGELDLRLVNPELGEYRKEEPETTIKYYSSSTEDSSALRMMEDFLRCLKTGKQPLTGGAVGERVNLVVDAAYLSIETGREIRI